MSKLTHKPRNDGLKQRILGNNASWWVDSLFIFLVLGSLFFILLGSRPLFVPDEGRYAEIAREMAASGDYVTPYLNQIKYFEKPVLFYWLGAAAIKVGGLNLWSIRSINALLGLLTCLLTYITGRKLYDRKTGFLAAIILGTSALYFVMAHMISLDLPVTAFLTATLCAFILANQYPPGKTRRYYLWGAATAAGLAVLTKGLIGIVFPAMIVGLWIICLWQWQRLKHLYLISCIAIFLLITAPWHILVSLYNPEFFYFYFIEQHFLRYTTMDVGHYQPVWFFIPALIIGFFPWIVFLPQALASAIPTSWRQRQTYQTELFLLIWAFGIFAFFSFSKSKLIPYILPVLPPLALLTARYLAMQSLKASKGMVIGFFALLVMSVLIGYGFHVFTHQTDLPDPIWATLYLCAASSVLVIGSLASCYYIVWRTTIDAMSALITTTWLFLLAIMTAMPSIDTRSILPIATAIKKLAAPGDEVITYKQYYQDLPFYLRHRVSIVDWRNELTYGMQHQATSQWMLNETGFWQRWHGKPRIFVVLSQNEFDKLVEKNPKEEFFTLKYTINNILISNRKSNP